MKKKKIIIICVIVIAIIIGLVAYSEYVEHKLNNTPVIGETSEPLD